MEKEDLYIAYKIDALAMHENECRKLNWKVLCGFMREISCVFADRDYITKGLHYYVEGEFDKYSQNVAVFINSIAQSKLLMYNTEDILYVKNGIESFFKDETEVELVKKYYNEFWLAFEIAIEHEFSFVCQKNGIVEAPENYEENPEFEIANYLKKSCQFTKGCFDKKLGYVENIENIKE